MNNPKRIVAVLAAAIALVGVARADNEAVLKTPKDQVSYAVGVQTGRNLRKDAVEVDLDLLMRGIKDGLKGEKLLLSEKELRRIIGGVQAEVRRKIAQDRRLQGEENRKAGDAFLADNAKKDGVVALQSGVQYKILKAGTGRKPTLADTVVVNYRGTRLDGFEFDASPDEGPRSLQMVQLVAGLKEVLQLMPVGSKWQIVLPAAQAYGARGTGQDIGPYQTLLFDMELVGIK